MKNEDLVIKTEEQFAFFPLNNRVDSNWKCYLFGCDKAIIWVPAEGEVPCWFWRKMQYLCLGHRWVKNGK